MFKKTDDKNSNESNIDHSNKIFEEYTNPKKFDSLVSEPDKINKASYVVIIIVLIIILFKLGYYLSSVIENNLKLTLFIFIIISFIMTRFAYHEKHDKNIIDNFKIDKLKEILIKYNMYSKKKIESLIEVYEHKKSAIKFKDGDTNKKISGLLTFVTFLGSFIDYDKISLDDLSSYIKSFSLDTNSLLTFLGLLAIIYYVYNLVNYKSNRIYNDLEYIINDLVTLKETSW